jgi:transposase
MIRDSRAGRESQDVGTGLEALLAQGSRVGARASAVLALRRGSTIPETAERARVTERTIRSWWRRYAEQGAEGLVDGRRTGRPARLNGETTEAIRALRSRGLSTRQIAIRLGLSQSSVARRVRGAPRGGERP